MEKIGERFRNCLGKTMSTGKLGVILLAGVALLLLGGGSRAAPGKSEKAEQEILFDQDSYTAALESRLKKILSTIQGASAVEVMITLEDGGQKIYAQNEKSESRGALENKEQTMNGTADASVVLKNDSGGGQSALLVKNNLPKISGVVVTAKGADRMEVKNNLISAVKAVLDVRAHRVQVFSK